MLRQDENEAITRVGPGTPMGNLMRQYWLPALLSTELPAPDSDPVRVLLLGEKLIAFRDTNGNVGLVQNHCPHRGASLFFGRNEECGLRCVYHGWKFDVDGNCVDMPNEPAESDFKHKVTAVAYPTRERGGVVWAYLGPRTGAEIPELPELESNMADGCTAYAAQVTCNWLQVLEGDIDTVHQGLLHYGSLKPEDQLPGTFAHFITAQRWARFEVIDSPAGVTYGARRPANPGQEYWRVAQFLFPIFTMAPSGLLGQPAHTFCRVPMDDEHTLAFFLSAGMGPLGREGRQARGPIRGPLPPVQPNGTDWYARFLAEAQLENDFLIDREVQRKNEGSLGYTGIAGVATQDAAMTVSMGPIFDRSQERLGSSDSAIIRTRRRLLDAARALEAHGTLPPGVDDAAAYRVRSGGIFLAEGADWVSATAELRKAFVQHPDLDHRVVGGVP